MSKKGLRSLCAATLTTLAAYAFVLMTSPAVKALEEEPPPETATGVSEQAASIVDDPQKAQKPPASPLRKLSPPDMVSSSSPPLYDPEGYDWIRLTSDEWLKGDIIVLRDDEIEFDSDEMDDQVFDWEDVAEIHSPREHTYVFLDKIVVPGPL